MKSEHRHELKENELGKLTIQAQTYLKNYSNQILLGLAGVLVVIIGLTIWSRMSNAAASVGWTLYAKADSAEDYANITEKLPKTEVGQWSRLNESENHLSVGVQNAFKDRKGALSDLKKAQEGFEAVLNGTPLPPELHERALYGLARTLEIVSGEDTSKAIEVYSKLLQAFPETSYKELAKQRVESLKKGSTQEFYAWFQAQNPTPEDRPRPKDGHPPIDKKRPGETETKSSDPGHPVDLPTKSPEGVPPKDSSKSESPEQPESSADKKPEDDQPSDSKKPADRKPSEADSKPDEKKPEEKKDDGSAAKPE